MRAEGADGDAEGGTVEGVAEPGGDGEGGAWAFEGVLEPGGGVLWDVGGLVVEPDFEEVDGDGGGGVDGGEGEAAGAAGEGEEEDHAEESDADALEDVEGFEPRVFFSAKEGGEEAEVELEEVAPDEEFGGADDAFADAGNFPESGFFGTGEEVGEDEAGDGEEHGCGHAADVEPGVVDGVSGESPLLGEGEVDEVAFEHEEDGDGARHVDEAEAGGGQIEG